MKNAAIYARVSSAQQKEEHTIASQTAALITFAQEQGYHVPREWIFEDEGFSGANLQRPGLEQIRDLAAEGQLQAVLVYSPDRLSRKYAYQVLLLEEFARHGVEAAFVKAPQGHSPEDQLLVQFQGMIAEYERAQILERSRRGKRHHARQGHVSRCHRNSWLAFRRLQPLRYLHSCSGCFRLELSPGGVLTHWEAPPYHGARQLRSVTTPN